MTDQTAHPNDGFEDDVVLADGVDEEPVESNRRTFGGWRLWLVGALAFFYAAFHMAALNGLSIGNIMALPTSIQADRAEGRAADSFDALKAALGPAAEDFEGNSNRRLLALAEEAGPGLDNADEVAALADSLTTASEAANDLNAEARSVSRAWGERLFFLPTFPLETWNFRIVHIAGALALGFLLFSPRRFVDGGRAQPMAVSYGILVLAIPALIALWTVGGFFAFLGSGQGVEMGGKYIWMSLPAMVDGAPNPAA